ncbi:L,D-transpeptidase [Xanthobacter oligotrophicus]|nr:L,D-transpeptidase [Xanthobacter oligotrophicus]
MTVSVNGVPRYSWLVSTARRGYVTPTGVYRPQRLYREYYSRKYYNSPMPYSIFYSGGFAIHGSYAVNQLGGPASHGCIRLHPGNAATLYSLVQSYGPGNTRIVITR